MILEVAKSDHRKTNFWMAEVEKMSRHHSRFFVFRVGEVMKSKPHMLISQLPTFFVGALPCPLTRKSNLEHRFKIWQKNHFRIASEE